jgi:hypothetical protein
MIRNLAPLDVTIHMQTDLALFPVAVSYKYAMRLHPAAMYRPSLLNLTQHTTLRKQNTGDARTEIWISRLLSIGTSNALMSVPNLLLFSRGGSNPIPVPLGLHPICTKENNLTPLADNS